MKKQMIGVILSISFCFMVASPPPIHATDVTLTVGNGSGFPGSPDDVVEVSLDNPSHSVQALQVDITDEGDHLTCTGCTPNPDRDSPYINCFTSELIGGSCRVLLISFDPEEGIPIGNGPLLSIDYEIKGSAPAGECKNLTPGAVKASGENNQSLDAVSVPGTFCFLSCQVNGECNDENGCTDDTCNAGQCTYQCNATSPSEPCCNNPACVTDSVCSDPSDTDHDGIPNSEDNCPNVYNTDQTNSDNDSYGNACDNCFMTDNEDQADADGNGIGDACEDIECSDVWPPESSPGAMNCGNGVVDVYDILAEVDFALGVEPDGCQAERANVPTGTPPYCSAPDGDINILDVMVLVDKTLLRTDCCSFFVCLSDGSCNDGLFCNGIETCLEGACQSGSAPCPGQMCNETNDQCADCLTDSDCDDGIFCNGEETCDSESGTCQPGDGNPCQPSASCNEEEDVCNCSLDEDCEDDLFCNGVGTCQDGACQIVTACPGQWCIETNDECVDCLTDSDCDDGTFCNGVETCDGGTCQPGDGNFCSPPYVCLEDSNQCVMPSVTLDIGDGFGLPGTTGNSIILNLDNPNDKVWGFQVDICDVDDFLTLDGCETTGRANVCECFWAEHPNGCDRIMVSCRQPDTDIQEGDGPVAILTYTVFEEAPVGECRDLNPEGAVVVDDVGYELAVQLLQGQFCFASESVAAIPTLSEWGIIIFMTIILGLGVVTLVRRKIGVTEL